MRRRHRMWFSVATTLALVAAACGGDDDSGGGLGEDPPPEEETTETTDASADACSGVTLEGSEVGVTPTEIRIAVIADTGSPLRPGLFQGSVDAVEGWARYKNENGGLACREVVVDTYDSKLSADEARNSVIGACGSDLALVGTTALFFNQSSVTEIEGCADQAGASTGIPDLAILQTEPAQQCSAVSYVILGGNSSCPYGGSGPRTFVEVIGPYRYYLEQHGDDTLHGVWVIPSDLPSTISSSMPGFRASQELGIALDYETGLSGLSEQSAYTPVVQEIKDNESTYARVGLDYRGTVFMRKEADVQGVDSVLVWDCSIQCYDRRLIEEGGTSVEDQYAFIFHLPFEDEGANETLDTFLEYVDNPDSFGAQAWTAAELFASAIETIVANDGANAITRAKLIETVQSTTDFDAGGMIPPINIADRGSSGGGCFVLLQVQGGEWVRVLPEEEGEFHCPPEGERLHEITIDPVAEFQGG